MKSAALTRLSPQAVLAFLLGSGAAAFADPSLSGAQAGSLSSAPVLQPHSMELSNLWAIPAVAAIYFGLRRLERRLARARR